MRNEVSEDKIYETIDCPFYLRATVGSLLPLMGIKLLLWTDLM